MALIHEYLFEGTWSDLRFKPCSELLTHFDYSLNLVAPPNNLGTGSQGNLCARVEQRGNVYTDFCSNPDEKHRTQMSIRDAFFGNLNVHQWVGFKYFIPTNHPTSWSSPGNYIFCQFQDPLTLMIQYSGGSSFSTNQLTDSVDGSIGSFTSGTKGQWNDMIIHRYARTQSDGRVEIWVNGNRVINYTGPTGRSDRPGSESGSQDLGIYWGNVHVGDLAFVVYFDAWRVATGTNDYDLVDPSQGGSAPTLSIDINGPYSGTVGNPIQFTSTVTENV